MQLLSTVPCKALTVVQSIILIWLHEEYDNSLLIICIFFVCIIRCRYTLMWLRDVGCPWDDARCREAANRNSNAQARDWIQMNGYTYFEDEESII